MAEIFDDFLSVINSTPENYGDYYIENVARVESFINEFEGVKTEVYLKNFTRDLSYIRFASVFSDLTNVYPKGLGEGVKIQIVPNQTLTINKDILSRFKFSEENKPIMNAGYLIRNRLEFKNFLSNIKPLINDKRVFVHNARCILGLKNINEEEKNRTWEHLEVEPSSPLTNWIVVEKAQENGTIPLVFKPNDNMLKKEIVEITIPYLKNIPIRELARVLNDYQYHLQKLRNEIKELVRLAKVEEKNIEEAKNDLVRPKIEEINRVFKKIKRLHRLRSYGVYVGMVPLVLTGMLTNEIAHIATGLLGASGVGLQVKNEVDYQKELQNLEELPLYLLWKIKNYNL